MQTIRQHVVLLQATLTEVYCSRHIAFKVFIYNTDGNGVVAVGLQTWVKYLRNHCLVCSICGFSDQWWYTGIYKIFNCYYIIWSLKITNERSLQKNSTKLFVSLSPSMSVHISHSLSTIHSLLTLFCYSLCHMLGFI